MFNSHDGGVPLGRSPLKDGQRRKWRRNIAETFNRLSRVHERYRETTDGRTMTCSERKRELTFAKIVMIYLRLSPFGFLITNYSTCTLWYYMHNTVHIFNKICGVRATKLHARSCTNNENLDLFTPADLQSAPGRSCCFRSTCSCDNYLISGHL